MSDLDRIRLALERDGLTLAGLRRRGLPIPSEDERLDDKVLIRDAARRLLGLTSPETIEKAAQALYEAQFPGFDFDEVVALSATGQYFKLAEAVLRSVEEGET